MPVSSNMKKFQLLMWKNYKIRVRSAMMSLAELVLPILLFLLLSYLIHQGDVLSPPIVIQQNQPDPINIANLMLKFNSSIKLCYFPNSNYAILLMEHVQKMLTVNDVLSYKDEASFYEYYKSTKGEHPIIAIAFKNRGLNMPTDLRYYIRPYFKDINWKTNTLFVEENQYKPYAGAESYLKTGFLSLQVALEISFLEIVLSNNLANHNFTLQEFPYPKRFIDNKAKSFHERLPKIISIGFIVTLGLALAKPTYDKKTGIKELMKSAGMNSWLIYLGWYFYFILVNVVSIIAIVAILLFPMWNMQEPMIKHTSYSLLFFFLYLYCSNIIAFGLLISSRFHNEYYASCLGLLLWFGIENIGVSYFRSWDTKMLACLIPSFAIIFVCQQIEMFEINDIGANWSNLNTSPDKFENALTISNAFCMMTISFILFIMFSLYLEQIYPGRYGISQPYYYIFYSKTCCRKFFVKNKIDSELDINQPDLMNNVEPPNPGSKTGVQINKLYKTYGKHRAVDDLSFSIYDGEITILLGRNGAGKTTTTSIVAGLLGATSGNVLVYGEDTRYNIDGIRSNMGYCPQHNCYFENLTVYDHFFFFGILKGQNPIKTRAQAETIMNELNLLDHRMKKVKELSGGMQRRLCLGVALMGKSKVLILDEPTTGLDPETRRELWDFIMKLKKSRSILITTHFMEEADTLADRIAIIDHGKLTCYGTPMFLKRIYGSGYHLALIRDKNQFEKKNPEEDQVRTITRAVQENLPEATLIKSNVNCLTYLLPFDKRAQYSSMLAVIENNRNDLCITHIQMTITTLEEVFLKAGSVAGKNERKYKFNLKSAVMEDKKRTKLQLYALYRKRWKVLKKRYMIYILPAILATLVFIAVLILTMNAAKERKNEQKPFDFRLKKYGNTDVYYSSDKTNRISADSSLHYKALVIGEDSKPLLVANVKEKILHEGNLKFETYQQKLIVAAEFSGNYEENLNAMFSNPSLHGATISVTLMSNAVLQALGNESYSIRSGISPLPTEIFPKSTKAFLADSVNVFLYWILLLPFGMLLLILSFLVLPQLESSSNLKQLQLMCGVKSLHYWGVIYLMDLCFYLMWSILMIIIMGIFQNINLPIFDSPLHAETLMVIFIVYGIQIIPFTYLFSYMSKVIDAISTCLTILPIVSIILLVFVWDNTLPHYCNYIFVLCPQCGLMSLLFAFCNDCLSRYQWFSYSEQVKVQVCKISPNPCCKDVKSIECIKHYNFLYAEEFSDEIIYMLIMVLSAFLYLFILIFMDGQLYKRLKEMVYTMIYREEEQHSSNYSNREDVKLQEERIGELLEMEREDLADIPTDQRENVLLAYNLKKSYKRVMVVKNVSFGVDVGECFGLLGVNGAGKTTTFRILTGNLSSLSGECRIITPAGKRIFLTKTPKKYLNNVGYCPQHDILEEVLSGRDMLRLFGRLRGISNGLDKEIQILTKCLGLEEYINRACGEYSGGNKRKLCLAMALIGVPAVILLDEPTSGVDPISRRSIWDTIQVVQNQKIKPAIVLTTHSMEECEVLCNKVAIMKNGEFQCYGTIPQLKSKYPKGFTVSLKLTFTTGNANEQQDQIAQLKTRFAEMYRNGCKLLEEYAVGYIKSLLVYEINIAELKWSNLFEDMEQLQGEFDIVEDYTITETTLEQVFLQIARS